MSTFLKNLKKPKFALLTAGLLAVAPMAAQAQSMEEAFAAADANGDGMLDVAEYQAYIDALASAGDEKAAAVKDAGSYSDTFTGLDSATNGGVPPAELGLS
mgnify:CR=1 FL=1